MTPHPDQARVEGLIERLRGIYRIPITDGLGAVGAGEEPDNPDAFVRKFEASPIMREAADALSELLSLRASPSAPKRTKKPLTAGWLGYWPGAGSVDSETKITRWQREAEAWRKDGATVTELVERSTEAPSPSAVTREPSGAETGWLLEWLHGTGPEWWTLTDSQGEGGYFAKDSIKALRFARREDAQAYIDEAGWTEIVPTEHEWSDPSPLTTPEPETQPVEGHVSVEYDGFVGNVIGRYVTREGKRGVVVQQAGTRVVHVYGESRVLPSPPKGPTNG